MCGIVGYVGSGCAVEAVLKGLALLEYRGYDSAGLAAVAGGRMRTVRTVGRVSDLAVRVAAASLSGARLAVGHTRWATHGRVSESNAHPHLDASGNVAIVHNGIIENSDTLRREMEGRGIVFASETDTEVAAQLIGELYCGDLVEAVERAIERLEGSFALAVVSPRHPDLIVGARRGPPLACAVSEAAAMLASDALPLSAISGRVAYLEEDQVAALFPGKLSVRRRGVRAEPAFKEIKWSRTGADLCGFPHYMLKEIHEQPASLRRLCSRLIADRGGDGAGGAPGSFPRFNLENLNMDDGDIRGISRIIIVGQGTAYHAAMIGRNMIERTARIPVQVEYGSDFRYRDPVLDGSVVVVAVSQSGETADTLGAVRLARERGCRTVGIINVEGSSIARECDGVVYMYAGPEIGVASTKAFAGQIAALYVLAIRLGIARGTLPAPEARRRVGDLLQVAARVEEVLGRAGEIEKAALKYKDVEHALYLGRGTGFPLALEGALKLKEVSYIHAEGYDAAEMKHGPIALVDPRMPCVFLALKGRRYEKIVSNIQEVRARGGRIVAIASHDDGDIAGLAEDVIRVPDDRGIMNSIVCAVPLQLIAYNIAAARGCDVDRPRNLAKSVTVE